MLGLFDDMDVRDRDKRLIALFVEEFDTWAGASYRVALWPDIETRDKKAVDAIAQDAAGRELAIEHTLLQPFAGDRADTVPFLKMAGRLDQRKDLAQANWMIELIFKVGATPKRVDWGAAGDRLEAWFIEVRPYLQEGRTVCEVPGLPFPLRVTVEKSPLTDTPGCLFVTRAMPKEAVDPILRTALGAKLPKLVATSASERVLLLELESAIRGNWEIGHAIDNATSDFPQLDDISGVWLAKTAGWETESYVGFHLIWPPDQVVRFQEWRRARFGQQRDLTAAE